MVLSFQVKKNALLPKQVVMCLVPTLNFVREDIIITCTLVEKKELDKLYQQFQTMDSDQDGTKTAIFLT